MSRARGGIGARERTVAIAIVAAAAGSLALLTTMPVSASNREAARTGGWITCSEAATLNFKPGLTLEPQAVRLSASDTITGCTSSDPAIQGGTAVVRAKSPAASCAGGKLVDGVAVINWDDGRRSRIRWSGAFAGAIANGRGAVVRGSAFVGQWFNAADIVSSPDPILSNACLSPKGLRSVEVAGRIAIGVPVVDG